MKESKIEIGISSESQIEFILLTPHRIPGKEICGKQVVTYDEGRILQNDWQYDELLFEPLEETAAFELLDATIGVNFHWERKEDQRPSGSLEIIMENSKLTGINVIHIEDCLMSVIPDEMSVTASSELLKTYAVISRNWLLVQIRKNKEITEAHTGYFAFIRTDEELIRRYDCEDYIHFDVRADDHCQRYQGITRASIDIVRQAIVATRGQMLTSEGNTCDTCFSKRYGGIFEEFQYCWEDTRRPYLAKQRDYLAGSGKLVSKSPDLTQEAEADRRIRTFPESLCNTMDRKILSQIFNSYNQETTDFYRWKVEYTQDELSALVPKCSGVSCGRIIDLVPVARGTSGRLWRLKIVGTKKTRTIGKELGTRRILSPSHLYSSAFVIDRAELPVEGIPGRFILIGTGWGHDVDLCQIDAAVMGEQGYQYDAILLHHYIGATIDKLYN